MIVRNRECKDWIEPARPTRGLLPSGGSRNLDPPFRIFPYLRRRCSSCLLHRNRLPSCPQLACALPSGEEIRSARPSNLDSSLCERDRGNSLASSGRLFVCSAVPGSGLRGPEPVAPRPARPGFTRAAPSCEPSWACSTKPVPLLLAGNTTLPASGRRRIFAGSSRCAPPPNSGASTVRGAIPGRRAGALLASPHPSLGNHLRPVSLSPGLLASQRKALATALALVLHARPRARLLADPILWLGDDTFLSTPDGRPASSAGLVGEPLPEARPTRRAGRPHLGLPGPSAR